VVDLGPILADLEAESRELDGVVAALPDEGWASPTPAPGWTIAHQIAHLAWTDRESLIAAVRPDEFTAEIEKAVSGGEHFLDDAAAEGAQRAPADLLVAWREGRKALAVALAAVPEGHRLPWFGPPMSAASMATARLMETWAHAQDVYDALGLRHESGDRIRHIARFGIRTRDFAFKLHSLAPPPEEFRVELTAPDGRLWAWGPEDAAQRVTGSALGFCLIVTQRRHPADTDVLAEGVDAQEWLGIAQAFAGAQGGGREAGQFG
jgi:uncharacterized protein (TIGR03084 family)